MLSNLVLLELRRLFVVVVDLSRGFGARFLVRRDAFGRLFGFVVRVGEGMGVEGSLREGG